MDHVEIGHFVQEERAAIKPRHQDMRLFVVGSTTQRTKRGTQGTVFFEAVPETHFTIRQTRIYRVMLIFDVLGRRDAYRRVRGTLSYGVPMMS